MAHRIAWVWGAALVIGGAFAYAQVDLESFQQLEFNFVPPGARATAMGGTFLGLADDATAAQTNPAGLVVLARPEVAFEFKVLDYGIERLAARDSLWTLRPDRFGGSVASPSFLSVTYPTGAWTVAAFRHEFLRLKDRYTLDMREVPGWWDPERGQLGRLFRSEGTLEMTGTQYGLAVAVRLGRIDVGAAAKLVQLQVLSSIRRDNCDPIPDTACRQGQTALLFDLDDQATGVGLTGGLVLRLSRRLQVGAVGELNPRVHWTGNQMRAQRADGSVHALEVTEAAMGVPNRVGVGVAYRLRDTLRLAADVLWVQYSRIVDPDARVFSAHTAAVTPDRFFIRDRWEFHGGLEYVVFARRTPVALRAGLFVNPERRIHYRRPPDVRDFEADAFDFTYNGLPDETNVGVSAGVGTVLRRRLQVDVALSYSKFIRQVATSLVFFL
ncbi:hypothetical protein HRbin11_00582 [bacterium HR11]|nr:hypothetical protein HRbin11_00582 [bacterium HR11]